MRQTLPTGSNLKKVFSTARFANIQRCRDLPLVLNASVRCRVWWPKDTQAAAFQGTKTGSFEQATEDNRWKYTLEPHSPTESPLMAPSHPQIQPILLSTEYKSLHFLNPAFPDLVLYAPTTSGHTIFYPVSLLCLEYSSTAPRSSFAYSTKLSSSINCFPLETLHHCPSLSTDWIRHLFPTLIFTTPFTIACIIVWLRIFSTWLWVSQGQELCLISLTHFLIPCTKKKA